MKLIQKIEADFTYYYYQKGTDFYMIEVACHGHYFDFAKYKAKSDKAILNLINHFSTRA